MLLEAGSEGSRTSLLDQLGSLINIRVHCGGIVTGEYAQQNFVLRAWEADDVTYRSTPLPGRKRDRASRCQSPRLRRVVSVERHLPRKTAHRLCVAFVR